MKRIGACAVLLFAAAACASAETDHAATKELRELESLTAEPLHVATFADATHAVHLRSERIGKPILSGIEHIAPVSLAVLEAGRTLFHMNAPARELVLAQRETDGFGMHHAKFRQQVIIPSKTGEQSVPVEGAQVAVHFDAAGHLSSVDSTYVPVPNFTVERVIAPEDAILAASAAALRSVQDVRPPELIVHVPSDGRPAALAYRCTVQALDADTPALWTTIVDAESGAILHQRNDIKTVDASGLGVMGDNKQFKAASVNSGFVMSDESQGVEIQTFTANQSQINLSSSNRGSAVTSQSANECDRVPVGAGAAVDAHFFASVVYRYYRETHNRNSIDGNGGPLLSTVHFGRSYDNAFWDGTGMAYGDGGANFRPLCVSLDVVGHEFSHGVIERTANLEYESQPGALNEAVADIFGAFIEHKNSPDLQKNWVVGEAMSRSGAPIRDMKDPGGAEDAQPGHMKQFVRTSQDNGGVHINSGIINNAAYLLTMGGTNPVSKVNVPFGIGWEKSEKLWYQALTKYFMERTNFGQAAQGMLQAAKDIGLTQNEINIVDCAFKATGVLTGNCENITDPAPKPEPPAKEGNPGDGASAGDADQGSSTNADGKSDSSSSSTSKSKSSSARRKLNAEPSSGCAASPAPSKTQGTALLVVVAAAAVAVAARRRNARS